MPEPDKQWRLEGYFLDGKWNRIAIDDFPYRLGRQRGVGLCLAGRDVSRQHAELRANGDTLLIRDLDSTNGTFVNLTPIVDETVVREGDIIHLGGTELRLQASERPPGASAAETRHGARTSAGTSGYSRELREMLRRGQVRTVCQAIVAPDETVHGREILGRGAHPGLPEAPAPLFRIAETLGEARHLSAAFRDHGLREAVRHDAAGRYFVNTHPGEVADLTSFVKAMEQVRRTCPSLDLVVELHEAAFTDLAVLAALKDALKGLDMKLAFDDFGAGQSRLLALADDPPDYIKVDLSLIRDIDRAPRARRQMIRMVLDVAHDADSRVIAEGVSRAEEAAACLELGFDLLQGFYLGCPEPLAAGRPA